jgi:TonB family protein
VTHAVSAAYIRFNRMSPTAAALAVLLHVTTALALWWVSPLHYTEPENAGRAIDVTMEPPPIAKPAPPAPEPTVAPPAPSAPPAAKPAPPPQKATPLPLGLSPPVPKAADTPQHTAPPDEVQKPQQPQEAKSPTQPERAAPDQQPAQPQRLQALAPKERMPKEEAPKEETPKEAAPPPAQLEHLLPPLEAPPAPLTSKDLPSPRPPPAPAHVAPHPQAHAAPPAPQQHLRPSPLSNAPQRRAPGRSQPDTPSATFINPAEQYNQTQLVERYLWQVATKISQYHYHANQVAERGTVVLRLVMARDGRLLDVSIARSSGVVTLDKGLIEAARAAAPYAPFPSGLAGAEKAFLIPFASVYRPR